MVIFEWWIWLSAGLLLLGFEMFIPTGMYLLIFGLSLIIVGGLSALGILASFNTQAFAAAAITVVLLFTVRRPLQAMLKGIAKPMGSDITAQVVTISENIAPGAIGKGQLSGSTWNVKNESSETLVADSRAAVAKVDGITLVVK